MTNLSVRRKQFKAALALANMSKVAWATEHGVTDMHLNEVLKGKRTSERLNAEIDAFIAKHVPQKKAQAA